MTTHLLVLATIAILTSALPIEIPRKWYLKELAHLSTRKPGYYVFQLDFLDYVYDQASLEITLPENPEWEVTATTNLPYAMVQLSGCQDDFSQMCVFATNYEYGSIPQLYSKIVWDIDPSALTIYLRILGGYAATVFSLKITLLTGVDTQFFAWQTSWPFDGASMVGKTPKTMNQIWKSDTVYDVMDSEFKHFFLPNSDDCAKIDVTVETVTASVDFSLIQQWACHGPESNYEYCRWPDPDWKNAKISIFSVLEVRGATSNGVNVVVSGYGANVDGQNHFTISASEHQIK